VITLDLEQKQTIGPAKLGNMIKLKDLLSECWECERDKQGKDFTHGEDGNAPMADGELRSIASNASKLISMVHPEDQLPAWALAKITVASENLASVARYISEMEAEMGGEEEPTPGYEVNPAMFEDKNWIQKAVNPKHKGALHKALHVGKEKDIPQAKLNKATHSKNAHLRHMAQFAKNVQK